MEQGTQLSATSFGQNINVTGESTGEGSRDRKQRPTRGGWGKKSCLVWQGGDECWEELTAAYKNWLGASYKNYGVKLFWQWPHIEVHTEH